MRKIAIVLIVLFATVGIAYAEQNPDISTKYLGKNKAFGTLNMQGTLKNGENGNIVYIENYYSLYSNGNKKFYSSNRYELNGSKIFYFQRTNDRNTRSYRIIEKIILKDGKIVRKSTYDLLLKK